MRAVVVEKFGPIDSHSLGELPSSSLRANEVLVSIKACAVNFVDLLVINGKYQFLPNRPFAPGKLPVGVITKTGPGVDQVSVGERVLDSCRAWWVRGRNRRTRLAVLPTSELHVIYGRRRNYAFI